MSAQRSILTIGLGRHIAGGSVATAANFGGAEAVWKMVQEQQQLVRDLGFYLEGFQADPSNLDDAATKLEPVLKSRKWDGVVVGWGARGTPENTVMFEKIINMMRILTPEARFIFNSAPNNLAEAVNRNFP